ncbi:hypothetical protein GF386_03225 [Candidatus Pacearchaeota archaeon]|nr:hypothetical protein [Candidatus Pacearchaeota archaeon]MBD3283152.1 hypothetical protein [Candidatus Pacearchaeota archaeon]
MHPVESRTINSFRKLKSDIIDLQNELSKTSNNHDKLMKDVLAFRGKETKVKKVVKKTAVPARKKFYVAAKEGKKYHIPECPYAKNIKPKSKLSFKTKDAALNKGYKPCSCVVK